MTGRDSEMEAKLIANARQRGELLDEVARLRAYNERLRGLIRTAAYNERLCLWCLRAVFVYPADQIQIHEDNCPAFTPTGEVK